MASNSKILFLLFWSIFLDLDVSINSNFKILFILSLLLIFSLFSLSSNNKNTLFSFKNLISVCLILASEHKAEITLRSS